MIIQLQRACRGGYHGHFGVGTCFPGPNRQLTVDRIEMSAGYNEIAHVGNLFKEKHNGELTSSDG